MRLRSKEMRLYRCFGCNRRRINKKTWNRFCCGAWMVPVHPEMSLVVYDERRGRR
jgi:uncharacterized protein YlaI